MSLQASFAALVVMGGGGGVGALSKWALPSFQYFTHMNTHKKTYGITESTNAHDDGLKSEFKPTGVK